MSKVVRIDDHSVDLINEVRKDICHEYNLSSYHKHLVPDSVIINAALERYSALLKIELKEEIL